MIFKQRFEDGRTQFRELGNDFVIVKRPYREFDFEFRQGTGMQKDAPIDPDMFGYIEFKTNTGEFAVEPLFKQFNMWLYSDDGKLFLTLN